ncbi:MAG: PBP1A family penicillin-binding protein, partial [Rhodospirillales bacterium]|nr:PBP1A family penicillin-binding protein [Rhodospirillales bacterium]
MLGAIAVAAVVFLAWIRFAPDLPSVAGLRHYRPPVTTRVYAADGRMIDALATQRRVLVPFKDIPPLVQNAFLAAEDQNYWLHPGVDPVAILRAALWDVMHLGSGHRPLGASTITMQVAKNLLLQHRMTFVRKIEEAFLALRIDRSLSKQRILEIYLNEIYLGNGTYGVAAAAEGYFGKPLDKLTIAEAASLAALPKAPSNYNPLRFPAAARIRRDWVIDRMADDHAITSAQAAAAKADPLLPASRPASATVADSEWFASDVQRALIARFGATETMEGGLSVATSLDPRLQAAATRAVRDGLMAYDQRMGGWRGPLAQLPAAALSGWEAALAAVAPPPGMLSTWRLGVVLPGGTPAAPRVGWLQRDGDAQAAPAPRQAVLGLGGAIWHRPMSPAGAEQAAFAGIAQMVRPGDVVLLSPPATPGAAALLRQVPKVQGALVSLDPVSGRVRAMVGGWRWAASQFNRATQAQRQPGSSFKPFVYLTALEQGYSPSTRLLNAPIVVNLGPGGLWRPHNYEDNFGGPTSLRVALEQSLNLVTVRLARRVGMARIAATAKAFGLVRTMPLVLPAALGAVDTTVLAEAAAYATLDNGGRKVTPRLIDSVADPDGHVVWRPSGLACACDDPATPPQLTDLRPRIADPASVFQLVTMMQGVVTRGTGIPAGKGLNRPIAGKTGTTENFQDGWFSGFTPQLVTVVWVGFDTPSSLGRGQAGAVVAAPIWHQFMQAALDGKPALPFPAPPGVTMASWDSGAGMVTDAFKPGQTPGADAA